MPELQGKNGDDELLHRLRPLMEQASFVRLAPFALALCCAALAPQPPSTAPNVKRSRDGYYAETGRSYIDIPAMPKPIQPRDIAQWSALLRLSEAQQVAVNHLYEEYVQAEEATHIQFVQPLWDRSAAIRDGAPPHLGVERALQLQKLLLEDRPQAIAHIAAVEERLFSGIDALLSDVQLGRLYEVRSRRERARCNREYSRYPGGHIDLMAILADLEERGMDCEALDAPALDRIVEGYDTMLGPLFSACAKAHVDVVAKAVVLQARILDGQAPRDELAAQQHRYRSRLVAAEKRVHDLNAQYVHEFAAVLPAPCASALVQYFNEVAYPPVYPDPTDLSSWYEAVLALPSLEQSRRGEILAFRGIVELRRERLCAQLRTAYVNYREAFGIGDPGGSIDAYGAAADGLHAQRIENARFAITTVSGLLSESELRQIQGSLAIIEQNLSRKFFADPSRRR